MHNFETQSQIDTNILEALLSTFSLSFYMHMFDKLLKNAQVTENKHAFSEIGAVSNHMYQRLYGNASLITLLID